MASNSDMESVPLGTIITIPDFFKDFLTPEPKLALGWEILCADQIVPSPKSQRAQALFESFAYFAAANVPDADLEDVRVVRDYLWWIFSWDDHYDEGGKYSRDRDAGAASYLEMVNILENKAYTAHLSDLGVLLESICNLIWVKSTSATWAHFQRKQKAYMEGVLDQVTASDHLNMATEARVSIRNKTNGAEPLYALVEFAMKLNIPDKIIESEEIHKFESVCVELIVLHNDALSWFKEFRHKYGQGHLRDNNTVEMLRYELGGDLQAAMDATGKKADELLVELCTAELHLPSGLRSNREVQTYIEGCKKTVIAALWWSMNTCRYFDDPETVRRIRQVCV